MNFIFCCSEAGCQTQPPVKLGGRWRGIQTYTAKGMRAGSTAPEDTANWRCGRIRLFVRQDCDVQQNPNLKFSEVVPAGCSSSSWSYRLPAGSGKQHDPPGRARVSERKWTSVVSRVARDMFISWPEHDIMGASTFWVSRSEVRNPREQHVREQQPEEKQ